MKLILALFTVIISVTAQAQDTRSLCENAYYATNYVKLHQYTVTVQWEKVSDHAHERLENIIYDYFKVLSVNELSTSTVYKIKEDSKTNETGYAALIEELKSIPTNVSCTYDI